MTKFKKDYKKTDERIGNIVMYDHSLPDCIITDLDGTLSLMNGRCPLSGENCGSDLLNPPVMTILDMYQESKGEDDKIIIFSGRKGETRKETEMWLDANGIDYDEMHMRGIGGKNNENDAVLKENLYNEHIKGKYNVKFVLDDRTQVVKLWRSLGLPCFQVYWGDF